MIIQAALAIALGALASPSAPLQASATATASDLDKSARTVEKSLLPVHEATMANGDRKAKMVTRFNVTINRCNVQWLQKVETVMYLNDQPEITSIDDFIGQFNFNQIVRVNQERTDDNGNEMFSVLLDFSDKPSDHPEFKHSMAMTTPDSSVDPSPIETSEKVRVLKVYFNKKKAADRALAALRRHLTLCSER